MSDCEGAAGDGNRPVTRRRALQIGGGMAAGLTAASAVGDTGASAAARQHENSHQARFPTAEPSHDLAPPLGYHDNWRFCTKCYCLFWYGAHPQLGVCPVGGGHSPFQIDSLTGRADSEDFELPIASFSPA